MIIDQLILTYGPLLLVVGIGSPKVPIIKYLAWYDARGYEIIKRRATAIRCSEFC